MSKFTEKEVVGLSQGGLGLDDLVRQGAREVIEQAIEAELPVLLEQLANFKTLHGQCAVVRNGYRRTILQSDLTIEQRRHPLD